MGKKKKILILSGLILLLVAGAVGAYFGFANRQPVSEEITSKLYWNADRDQYIPELGGDTIRKPEKDGFYTVRFLVEGELVEYRVKDRETMISVDEKSALGLEIDKDGFITKAIDIRDMGIREVAKSFYVQTMQENVVVANSSVTGSAVDVSLRLSSESKIWNVTGKVDPFGVEDKLQLMDCIRAFNNESGTITDVFIVEREDILNGVSAERYCDHCGEVVTWRMWLGATSLPYSSGHFRLITDVELPEQYSMPADVDAVFDLNGKTISRKTQGRIISLHSEGDTLSIIDGSEEKTGMIKAFGEYAANGGVIWVRYGTLNLYAGTINASEVVDAGANGAAIQVNPDTTFNMYGGTIIGGTAKPAVLKNEETGEKYTSGGMGGSIYCQGTINMYGGEILDGKVVSAKDHKGEMAGIAGGNITLISKGIMNMYGGKISGGKVAEPYGHGGNISVRSEGAVLNISGGEIVKGVSTLQGANIASWGTITMTGGTIKDGKNVTGDSLKGAKYNETSTSHNMFLVSSKFDMSGGTVAGHIGATNGLKDKNGNYIDCNIIVSGTAKIKGANTNLTAGTSMIHFGKLSGDAYVSVNGSGFISTDTVATNQKYVHSDYEGSDVLYLEKRLFIGKQSCVCGLDEHGKHFGECDGILLAWQPWTKGTYAPYESGNWYLLTDVESEGINEAKPDATIRLDLNGKKIVGKVDRRVYSTVNGNVNLTITDLSENRDGSIVARSGDNAEGIGRGGCVWVTNKKSKVTFYGGILDASKVTALYNGAAVSVDPDCEFTMYGGTINGGKAVVNKKGEEGYAGTVFVRGQFNLNGGVIQGGRAEQYGGNVYVHDEKGAKFHMTGGKVIGGNAYIGGNISGLGPVSIAGGTVVDGQADFGGNICARREMIMTGGEIKDGVAQYGGNIYASDSSDVTISGGTISGGKATDGEGGNLRIWTNSKLNISNATIKDGIAKKDGGNIYLNDLIDVQITNATIIGGKSSANGGNICIGKEAWEVKNYTKAIISGGTIKNGHAANLGGNVYVRKSVTTLSGDISILGGTSGTGTKEISNMYLAKDVKVALNDLSSAKSSIGINSVNSTFATNANVDKTDIARFISDGGYPIAQTSENEIFLGRIGCMCGNHNGSHKTWCTDDLHNIEWHAWRDDKTLPEASGDGIYYYLTSDVKLNSTLELKSGGTWRLDLNGKKVSSSNRILSFMSNVKSQITDTSAKQSGTFTYNEGITSASTGMLFFVTHDEATVDFYAGTIDGAGVRVQYAPTLVVSKGTFIMHDGLILPGNRESEPEKGNYATNCVEVREGILDVRGGTIEGEVRITTDNGKIKLSGSPRVGVAVSADANKTHGIFALNREVKSISGKVECSNVSAEGEIVFKNTLDMSLTGTGEASAFIIADALEAKYNHITDNNPNGVGTLSLSAKMRSCGDANCNGTSATHTCEVPKTLWRPWNKKISMDSEAKTDPVKLPSDAGYYYLTDEMNLDSKAWVGGVKTCVDLNGYKVTATNTEERVIVIGSNDTNYSITDSSVEKTGAIQFAEGYVAKYNGMLVFYEKAKGSFNLYAGTLDMSNVTQAQYNMIDVTGGKFKVHGGTIIPAATRDSGASNCIGMRAWEIQDDVYIFGAVEVTGGTVYGEVLLQFNQNSLTVKGDAQVGVQYPGNDNYGIEAKQADAQIICDNLSENAQIVIKKRDNIKLTEPDNSNSSVNAVRLINHEDEHVEVIKYNGKLRVASVICVCGANVSNDANHTCAWVEAQGKGIQAVHDIAWKPYTVTTGTLPGCNEAGYYYLTNHLTLEQSKITAQSYLDLNGFTVMAPVKWNIIIDAADAHYSVTDSEENGTIKLSQDHGVYGGLLKYNQAGKFSIYDGTIDLTDASTVHMIDVIGGEFIMHGGVVKAAHEKNEYSNCIATRGNGTVTVTGGTIYGDVLLEYGTDKLKVSGDAKVGLPMDGITSNGIKSWASNSNPNVICTDITDNARIVFAAPGNIKLSEGYELVAVENKWLLQKKAAQ